MLSPVERLKTRLIGETLDESKTALLEELLRVAKNDILRVRYPFKDDITSDTPLEYRYEDLQIELALIKYNMLGVEGQVEHDENGVKRTYENTLLTSVTPLVGVPKTKEVV